MFHNCVFEMLADEVREKYGKMCVIASQGKADCSYPVAVPYSVWCIVQQRLIYEMVESFKLWRYLFCFNSFVAKQLAKEQKLADEAIETERLNVCESRTII